jgi:tetratricopeptide (TPR) repeat protein
VGLAFILAAGLLAAGCSPDAKVSPAALAQAHADVWQGEQAKKQKRYAEALSLYQRAYPVLDEAATKQGEAFDRASMMLDYLQLLDFNHRYAELLALSRSEIENERRRSGPDSELEGYLIEAEAAALFGLGRRAEAIARYRDAMAFVERTEGPADSAIAWYWILIAELNLDSADAAGAQAALVQAARRLDPPDFKSRSTMALVEQLARLAAATGKSDLALTLLKRAVAYGELVEREPEAQAVTVSELAEILAARGDHAQAVTLHRRALPALQAVLGEAHPLCSREMARLASALASAGQREEALRLMQRSVELADEVLGPNHPDTVARRERLARLRVEAPRKAAAARGLSAARTSSAAPART